MRACRSRSVKDGGRLEQLGVVATVTVTRAGRAGSTPCCARQRGFRGAAPPLLDPHPLGFAWGEEVRGWAGPGKPVTEFPGSELLSPPEGVWGLLQPSP